MTATELRLRGSLSAPGFDDWICHRARLLSLSGWMTRIGPAEILIVVSGPEPLIDAMEQACSLGPVDVLVERIDRRRAAAAEAPNGFHKR